MTRAELIKKVQKRKEELGISIENLAKLSHIGVRTTNRFFAGEDVKLSTIETVINFLGLDFAGNEIFPAASSFFRSSKTGTGLLMAVTTSLLISAETNALVEDFSLSLRLDQPGL